MYCKYCGTEIIEGKRFCAQCGKPANVSASAADIPGRCDICNRSSAVRAFDFYAYTSASLGETRDVLTNTVTMRWTERDFMPLSLECCDECILKRMPKKPVKVPPGWQDHFLDEIKKMVSANGRTDWCTREAYRVKEIKQQLDDLKKTGTPGAWSVEDSVLYYAIVEKRFDKCAAFGAPAVGPLIELAGLPLSANPYDVLYGVSDALGRIGPPSVEPLIKAMEDDNKQRRSVAARALGRIGDPRAVRPLEKALEDEDKEVRTQARKALKKIRGK